MLAGASLLLGLAHAMVWIVQPRSWLHLAFAVAAISVAVLGLLELAMLQSDSAAHIAMLLRWMQVPGALMVVCLVYAVHSLFGSKAPWLPLAIIGLRLASVLLNFSTGQNLIFLSVDAVHSTQWWGATIHYPVGTPNPWVLVSQLSNAMLLVYLVQTLARVLAHEDNRRWSVVLVCGSCLLLVLLLLTAVLLMALGLPRLPITAAPCFMLLVAAMSWQSASGLLSSRRLTTLLEQSETERLRVERDLDMAAATSGLGLWYWDVARGEFVQNANNRELLGNTFADLTAEAALFGHADPDDAPSARRNFHDAILQSSYGIEYRTISHSGERRWISLHGSVEHDAQQRPVMVRGVTQDVSRRRSEEELLRSLLEAAPTALLLVDPAGVIRFANEQATLVFGYQGDGMTGLHVDTLLPGQLRERHASHRRDFVAHPQARPMGRAMELRAVTRDEREICVEVSLNPLHLDSQLHIVASVVDLTERKRIERELALEREGLAHLSRVTMLGELSGSIAHELNQPLAAILSNAQAAQRILLRDPTHVGEVQEILADIVDNDRRAGQVIVRLRGLLKKEYREHVPVDLNVMVRDCLRLIRNELLHRGVECRLDLGAVPYVSGDRVQLQQVMINLIVNACDALTDTGERLVVVRTRCSDHGVLTEVVDSGRGIGAARLESIFEPFETTKPDGMGIGLAVCRTILRAHDGRIWAEDAPGGGARLCFDLPREGARR